MKRELSIGLFLVLLLTFNNAYSQESVNWDNLENAELQDSGINSSENMEMIDGKVVPKEVGGVVETREDITGARISLEIPKPADNGKYNSISLIIDNPKSTIKIECYVDEKCFDKNIYGDEWSDHCDRMCKSVKDIIYIDNENNKEYTLNTFSDEGLIMEGNNVTEEK